MHISQLLKTTIALLACLMALPSPADTPETVATRKRPEIDPLGIRLGAFNLDSSVAVGYMRDNNIFATDTAVVDDVDDNILLLRPEILLASGWGRHSLRVGAEADLGRYDENGSEDYDDSRIFADGRVDLARGNVTAGAAYSDLHEPRTSADDAGGLEPTTYSMTAANLAWLFQPGALFVKPDVRYQTFSFDDTPCEPGTNHCVTTTGSTTGSIDNGDRDRDVINAGLRAGYELSTDYDVFVEGRAASVDYDLAQDRNGFDRSSDGYQFMAGSSFDLGGKTFGEIFAGYRSWSYSDPRFENIDGLVFGLDLTWNATPLTTLTASGASTIESTTIVNAAGIQRTAFDIGVDHELLRDLILWARVSAADEDFHGIDRDDRLLDAAAGARYLMNRHLYLVLEADTERRNSSGADSGDQDYDINRIQFRVQWNL